jgi:hypothetical protein
MLLYNIKELRNVIVQDTLGDPGMECCIDFSNILVPLIVLNSFELSDSVCLFLFSHSHTHLTFSLSCIVQLFKEKIIEDFIILTLLNGSDYLPKLSGFTFKKTWRYYKYLKSNLSTLLSLSILSSFTSNIKTNICYQCWIRIEFEMTNDSFGCVLYCLYIFVCVCVWLTIMIKGQPQYENTHIIVHKSLDSFTYNLSFLCELFGFSLSRPETKTFKFHENGSNRSHISHRFTSFLFSFSL